MGLLNMGKSPRPICDVCNKKVEQMDIETDSRGFVSIVVHCHGDTEYYGMQAGFAASMDKNTSIGRVFTKKRDLESILKIGQELKK